MKNLLILGAGTAGTMMVNHLSRTLPKKEWKITIVDQIKTHYYQPGFLFLPFDMYTTKEVKKVEKKFIPKEVHYIQEKIELIIPEKNQVKLEKGEILPYDILIVATGAQIAPEGIEGMKGPKWRKNIFDFYTFEGSKALRNKLRIWKGGKLLIHIAEMPIKCPVAPLEFTFLANSFFKNKGMRDKVDITFVTPLSGAFTTTEASKVLHYLLVEKNVKVISDFNIERVDYKNNKIIDYTDKEIEYDLLVTIPTNMGDALIKRSGLGDDLNYIPTNKATLQTIAHENIFALGDATNLIASKAGAVAHF